MVVPWIYVSVAKSQLICRNARRRKNPFWAFFVSLKVKIWSPLQLVKTQSHVQGRVSEAGGEVVRGGGDLPEQSFFV